jgi:trimeric autotransporter adhesin
MSAIRGSMRQPMRLSQRTPFIRGSAATVQNPLDNLDAAAAYSLRKLRTAYGGDAVNVRRSTDNLEIPIGFIGNELDTAALLSHCGAGNGFVTTLYDQSGEGRHATQATAANQPQIMTAGVVNTENGKPALIFDGVDDHLNVSLASTDFTVNVVSRLRANANLIYYPLGMGGATGLSAGGAINGQKAALYNGTTALKSIEVIPLNTSFLLTASSGSSERRLNYNGNTAATDTVSQSITTMRIGSRVDNVWFYDGSISEILIFSSILSTPDRQTVERNQGEYYEITVA